MPFSLPPSSDIPDLVGYSIDHGRLRFTEILGSGSNGVIFLAEETSDDDTLNLRAVKCLVKAEKGSRRYALQRQEIFLHRMASHHPHVVTLHRVIEEKYYFFLVLDYCRGGDFFNYLATKREHRGDDAFIRDRFSQILDAVEACHNMGIFHRDIKPENILVSEDGSHLYLTDFGLATTNIESRTFGAGSSLFMSPECISQDGGRTAYSARKNDIWALGVILTSMLSGHNPWNHANTFDACYRAYLQNPDFLKQMLPISDAANRILVRIFQPEAKRRIGILELRALVAHADTFFMSPADIENGTDFVRSAAASFFKGSRRESLAAEVEAVPAAAESDSEDEDEELFGSSPRHRSAPAAEEDVTTNNSTDVPSDVESIGPITPEPRSCRSSVDATGVGFKASGKRDSTGSGFLRRMMDRLFVE